MKIKTKNTKKGFTLIETLLAMAIFVLIVGVLTLFAKNIWVYNSFISTGLSSSDTGRRILKTMVAEIRTASAADTGVYTIGQAGASSFTFYSNIDSDPLKEKIRYFISGTNLQKGVTKPTGNPLTYNPLNEKVEILANNLISTSIFQYYNKFYDGETAALAFPINVADIRLVKITITTDQDPNRSPAPMIISTQVSIRNLKDNL